MLSKKKYVQWMVRLIRYAKSKPNRKLLPNSILHGPYTYRIITTPGDPTQIPPIPQTTRIKTDMELTKAEAKQVKANDQAIHLILMGLPVVVYVTVHSPASWTTNLPACHLGNEFCQKCSYTYQDNMHD
ncbi:hypothetical protein Tco_1075143 [Tanacetum coccineum]